MWFWERKFVSREVQGLTKVVLALSNRGGGKCFHQRMFHEHDEGGKTHRVDENIDTVLEKGSYVEVGLPCAVSGCIQKWMLVWERGAKMTESRTHPSRRQSPDRRYRCIPGSRRRPGRF